jgi:aminoglycoside phosphotransferase (APT) family kinase protein
MHGVEPVTATDPWLLDEPPEVAPVRGGEELPWDSLRSWLRPRLADQGFDVPDKLTVQQFPNGSANLTYLLAVGDTRVVLRRPPFGVIAPGAHDMRREFRVLSRLWEAFDRAPRAYLHCDDHVVIGSDFVVSEYREGVVIWASWPGAMRGMPDAGRRVGFAAVDALAELHSVDPASCGLGELGRPNGYLQRQLDGWRQRWDLVAAPEHDPTMAAVATLLHQSLPRSTRATILHNDFKLDNCQFGADDLDRVRSVFDWDQATLGDPLADLGTLLNYWPDPSDTEEDHAHAVPGLERLGLPTRAEVIERYASRTGTAVDQVAWYEAFACWKTAVVCQQLYQRYVRGESSDERMILRGEFVGPLAARALRIAQRKP